LGFKCLIYINGGNEMLGKNIGALVAVGAAIFIVIRKRRNGKR
jgi:hypothetical protein